MMLTCSRDTISQPSSLRIPISFMALRERGNRSRSNLAIGEVKAFCEVRWFLECCVVASAAIFGLGRKCRKHRSLFILKMTEVILQMIHKCCMIFNIFYWFVGSTLNELAGLYSYLNASHSSNLDLKFTYVLVLNPPVIEYNQLFHHHP